MRRLKSFSTPALVKCWKFNSDITDSATEGPWTFVAYWMRRWEDRVEDWTRRERLDWTKPGRVEGFKLAKLSG